MHEDKLARLYLEGLKAEIKEKIMENARRLQAALSGARFVQYDEDTGLSIAWHGGHTVRVYNGEGREVAGWQVGDYSKRPEDVTLVQVQESVQERMADKDYPWYA